MVALRSGVAATSATRRHLYDTRTHETTAAKAPSSTCPHPVSTANVELDMATAHESWQLVLVADRRQSLVASTSCDMERASG